ncbi:MAG: protein phosphatase 2C domain-containing protein [Candidatus Lernaella stagnicola]|nr:protein phosphatase 2C domain-containing protein [Candidatus Lernaella stagnicola]
MIAERGGESEFFRHFSISTAYATQTGIRHTVNEDRFLFFPPGNRVAEREEVGFLFAVYDGCGGSKGGAKAAQLAADSCRRFLIEAAPMEPEQRIARFDELPLRGNQAVFDGQAADKKFGDMACAGTLCWIWEPSADTEILRARFAHVGDTRAYLLREGHARVLTRDQQVGGVLSNVYGTSPRHFVVDSIDIQLQAGDMLLIGSDGLWKPYDVDLLALAAEAGGDPLRYVRAWLSKAYRNGSDDDLTAIACFIY